MSKIIGLYPGNTGLGFKLALLEISGSGPAVKFKILHTCRQAYNNLHQQSLEKYCSLRQNDPKEIERLDACLAHIWAKKIKFITDRYAAGVDSIAAIGYLSWPFNDQTMRNKPAESRMTPLVQISDPAVLARLTGINIISDFYVGQHAAGKAGGNILSYTDWLQFSRLKKNVLLVNLGRQTDCTYIPADEHQSKIKSFIAGPGNKLIDELTRRLYEVPFDRNGTRAGLGRFSEKLFGFLQKKDEFIAKSPARDSIEDSYGTPFVLSVLRQALRWRIPEPDILNTVSRYLVFRVWKSCQDFLPTAVKLIILSGSGSHNVFIRKMFPDFFQAAVKQSSGYDLPEDFREAVAAALLANEYERSNAVKSSLPGSRTGRSLIGTIYRVNKNRS